MPKAVYADMFKGPGHLRLGDHSPRAPKPGEVQVRVAACGINASDYEAITGQPSYARMLAPFGGKGRILGSDVAGVVVAVGDGVTTLAPGQRVLADTFGHFGGLAETLTCPAKLWVPIPDDLPDVTAAALPQSGTIALKGMAGVRPGERVLINGAGGGSGPLALQLAKSAGAHVTVVDRGAKLAALAALGADETLDFTASDFAATGARYDLIFDLIGTRRPAVIAAALTDTGAYRVVGGPTGIMLATLFGGVLRRLTSRQKIGVLAVPQGPDRLAELMEMVQSGALAPLIGAEPPLAEAPAAIAAMGRGEITGKLVVRVAP